MSQIQTKFVQDNAIIGSKFRLQNNEMLRARNAANTGDVNIAKTTGADKWEYQVLPEVLSSLPVPSALKQLATVEYVQNYVLGKTDAKDAVNALADSNIALTGAGPLVIDGVTLVNGNRLILTGQTTASQNGIYAYAESAGTYTLTRSADAATSDQVTSGMYTKVISGTTYQGWESQLTTNDPITLGTTSLTFVNYPTTLAQIAGDMLTKSGNVWSIDLQALGGLESSNAGNVAGQLRVKVDTAALEKDKTVRLDPTTGAVVAKKSKKLTTTLNASDITNQYLDLPDVAGDGSVKLKVAGAGEQIESIDFTVNYTGGTGSKTRVAFAGGLASAGVSALAAGDVVSIEYMSF